MSDPTRHDPPADVLLLRERQRRLASSTHSASATDESIEEILVESDAIVDESNHAALHAAVPAAGSSIGLYRPLAFVTLSNLSWSAAVDHDALQNAIVCSPARDARGASPGWLAAVSTFVLEKVPHGEASLHVALAPDDVALLDRIGTRVARDDAIALVRAAALPNLIVGADTATISAASLVLAAYRRACLVFAWEIAVCGNAAADSWRERDASAVQLLSMLKALVGEI